MVQHMQISNRDTPHNRMRDKNGTIISIEAEKAFDKIWPRFMKKTLNILGLEGIYLNIIKAVYGDIIHNGEEFKAL